MNILPSDLCRAGPICSTQTKVLTADFNYELPEELIAQQPSARREDSRLLALERKSGRLEHEKISNLVRFLAPGDLLVLNDSRVIPARLRATRAEGSELEILLLEETATNNWWCMAKPAKKLKENKSVTLLDRDHLPTNITATLVERNEEGRCRMQFEGVDDIRSSLAEIGELPLPPYIVRDRMHAAAEDWERYQTVYANREGSIAAPTAGLHFTPELLAAIQHAGVGIAKVTLHVGVGTFAPVKSATLAEHRMHSETFEISPETAKAIASTKARGNRVIAVGTTTLRTLESSARANNGKALAGHGRTDIFIYPPANFKIVDALLTNFHLPCSTLLMLVSAFAAPGQMHGRETIMRAYEEAIRERYRFFSYGDAMFIV